MATATNLEVIEPARVLTRSTREQELQSRLVDLCGQAERCVVDSDDAAERATTLAAAIKNATKAMDEDRQTLVRPLNGVVKDINDRFKRMAEPAEPALAALLGPRGQLTLWNAEKKRQAEEKARLAREEAERQRLEEAERAQQEAARLKAEGDHEAAKIADEQAQQALESAAAVPADIKPMGTATRGTYGGSSGTRKVGKAELVSICSLLEWELENVRRGAGLKVLQVNESELGRIARAPGAKPAIPGVRFYEEESSWVRG